MNDARSTRWRWSVCGLLLLATMLNYMDRQTLSQLATDITRQFGLNNEQYGDLELTFGLAFVAGSIVIGLLVDRLSVRWMYPAVLIGWSLAGVATAYAVQIGSLLEPILFGRSVGSAAGSSTGETGYLGLLVCRGLLGFFEAGQWPCALVTSRAVLAKRDRTLGNSILQSGGALGAILTPLAVQLLVTTEPDGWRPPFLCIGIMGLLWVIPWLLMVRSEDLVIQPSPESDNPALSAAMERDAQSRALFVRRFLTLAIVVISINLTWHFFRAWMPKFLREFHHYEAVSVNYFTSAYYISADVGCITVGLVVKWLADRGWAVHSARMVMFWACCALTALTTVAAGLGHGPLLLTVLLMIGFGSLGLFPLYYSFTQELFAKHQGKVTGSLSAITWLVTAFMHKAVGRMVDATSGSYASGIFAIGLAPLLGALVLWWFWGRGSDSIATGAEVS